MLLLRHLPIDGLILERLPVPNIYRLQWSKVFRNRFSLAIMCFPARWHTVAIIIFIIILLQQNRLSTVMIYFLASWHRESPPGQFATANQTSPGNSDGCCPPNINQLASEKEDLFMGFRMTEGTFLLYCCRTSRYCVINICVTQVNGLPWSDPSFPPRGGQWSFLLGNTKSWRWPIIS